MADADAPPVLHRGIGPGPTRCRSCKAEIYFAYSFKSGKNAPFQKDDQGEFIFENGAAKHVGPRPAQLELGGDPGPQRYTSHFASCPDSDFWRKEKK